MGGAAEAEGGTLAEVGGLVGAPKTAGLKLGVSLAGAAAVAHGAFTAGRGAMSLASQKGRMSVTDENGRVNASSSNGGNGNSGTGKQSKVAPSKSTTTVGEKYTKKTEIRPGSSPGQSRAEYVRYKSPSGRTVRTYKDSYDRSNKFQHRKDLTGGPEGRTQ